MQICINCEECAKKPEAKIEGNIEASVFLSMRASKLMAAAIETEARLGDHFAVSACEHVATALSAAFPKAPEPPAPEAKEGEFVEYTLFEFKEEK